MGEDPFAVPPQPSYEHHRQELNALRAQADALQLQQPIRWRNRPVQAPPQPPPHFNHLPPELNAALAALQPLNMHPQRAVPPPLPLPPAPAPLPPHLPGRIQEILDFVVSDADEDEDNEDQFLPPPMPPNVVHYPAQRPYMEDPNFKSHYLDKMTTACPDCSALHWMKERLLHSSMRHPKFGMCCKQGKVLIPLLTHAPPILEQLLRGDDIRAKEFRKKIRNYNNAFAFCSLGVKVDHQV
ncbi:MAG: hypothetical protein ACREHG_08770, partial [Candidatus Saccharimonadales bacterium]